MPRPADLSEVTPPNPQVATIYTNEFTVNPGMLKAYATFIEAMQKAGATLEQSGSSVYVHRDFTHAEHVAELELRQKVWDEHQRLYEAWAAGEEINYEWQVREARDHAQREGLPLFPWEKEGKTEADLDSTLASIDEALS